MRTSYSCQTFYASYRMQMACNLVDNLEKDIPKILEKNIFNVLKPRVVAPFEGKEME